MAASAPQQDRDGNITRPQTPRGQVYIPNPTRPQTYYGTKKGDNPPSTSERR